MWVSEGIAPLILNLYTRWSEWSATCPAALSAGRATLVQLNANVIGNHRLYGPFGKEMELPPRRKSNHDFLIVHLLAFSLHRLIYSVSQAMYFLINPLNAELNSMCHLLALLELRHILHFSRIRVKGQNI
jgi:hypothetical protein